MYFDTLCSSYCFKCLAKMLQKGLINKMGRDAPHFVDEAFLQHFGNELARRLSRYKTRNSLGTI